MLGVSTPRLGVDPDFDLDVHLHRMRLPDGTGWDQVLLEARRMSLTDFDHDRPLWEASLIEGLEGGRAALLVKLHHAIADGQAMVMIGANLFEFTPQGTPNEPSAPPAPMGGEVTHREVSRANITDNVRRGIDVAATGAKMLAGLAAGTVKDPLGTWGDAADMVGSVGRFTAVPESVDVAAHEPTQHDVPLRGLRPAVRRDARRSEAPRRLRERCLPRLGVHRHGALPRAPRQAGRPVALQHPDQSAQGVQGWLGRQRRHDRSLPAPGEQRLHRRAASGQPTSRSGGGAKSRRSPWPTRLADASWLVPVPVLASAARKSDVTTSNVSGPPIPLYISGARAVGVWPLVATIGAAVNITMVTYDGTAFVGLSADDQAVPDLAALVDDLRDGFAEVLGGKKIGPADPVAEPRRGEGSSHAASVREEEVRSGAPQAKKRAAKTTAAKSAPRKRGAVKSAARSTAAAADKAKSGAKRAGAAARSTATAAKAAAASGSDGD